MTSTINADKIMNSSGDQDSGLDLLVNDTVKIKTANTDRVTVTDSAASMGDNFKLRLGAGNDLNVYHDGSNSYIEETGTGDLHVVGSTVRVRSDQINLSNNANSQDAVIVNSAGFVSRPQTPCLSASKSSSTQAQTISGTTMYVVTGLDSSYGNSHSVNNKSYFDSSTSRFTIPSGQPTGFYYCSFQTIMGITRPGSGTNWGYIAIRKGSGSNNHITEAYREVVDTSGEGSQVWETLNCSCAVV